MAWEFQNFDHFLVQKMENKQIFLPFLRMKKKNPIFWQLLQFFIFKDRIQT